MESLASAEIRHCFFFLGTTPIAAMFMILRVEYINTVESFLGRQFYHQARCLASLYRLIRLRHSVKCEWQQNINYAARIRRLMIGTRRLAFKASRLYMKRLSVLSRQPPGMSYMPNRPGFSQVPEAAAFRLIQFVLYTRIHNIKRYLVHGDQLYVCKIFQYTYLSIDCQL